jgi:hypothetical protein
MTESQLVPTHIKTVNFLSNVYSLDIYCQQCLSNLRLHHPRQGHRDMEANSESGSVVPNLLKTCRRQEF